LRTLCGLSTVEVARVLLVPEATMAKRLTRARQKVSRARIPLRVPAAGDLPDRVAGVCAVVHLAYTAGHAAGVGDQLVRDDLCTESRRLAVLLVELLGDQPGITPAALASAEGLLALLLLTDARRPTRTDDGGALVRLADQNRSRWRRDLIDEGRSVLQRSLARTDGRADTYQLQAAIALCHAEAPTWSDTDHAEVLRLYRILQSLHPNPVVDTNAAAANLEVEGPEATLAELDAIPEGERRHAWHTTYAEALLRGGRPGARAAFERAAASAPTAPERDHLLERAEAAST
jgi:RNA polymerase sigma-70 factor (ECF subfamily)